MICLLPVRHTPQSSPPAQGSSHHHLHSGHGAVLQPSALLSKVSYVSLCVFECAHVHAGPGFIRTGVAPRSPWLVKTQTCDVTAPSLDRITYGPQGLTLTPSWFRTCHINAQTVPLSTQDKQQDMSVYANTKTHTHTHTGLGPYATTIEPVSAVITIAVFWQSPKRWLCPLAHATTHRFSPCTHTHTQSRVLSTN